MTGWVLIAILCVLVYAMQYTYENKQRVSNVLVQVSHLDKITIDAVMKRAVIIVHMPESLNIPYRLPLWIRVMYPWVNADCTVNSDTIQRSIRGLTCIYTLSDSNEAPLLNVSLNDDNFVEIVLHPTKTLVVLPPNIKYFARSYPPVKIIRDEYFSTIGLGDLLLRMT